MYSTAMKNSAREKYKISWEVRVVMQTSDHSIKPTWQGVRYVRAGSLDCSQLNKNQHLNHHHHVLPSLLMNIYQLVN
jgi:hypothetical protein